MGSPREDDASVRRAMIADNGCAPRAGPLRLLVGEADDEPVRVELAAAAGRRRHVVDPDPRDLERRRVPDRGLDSLGCRERETTLPRVVREGLRVEDGP